MRSRDVRFRVMAALLGMVLLLGASGCRGGRFGNMMSRSEEIQLGQEAEQELSKEYRGKFITSGPQYEQLQRVSARIFPLAKRDFDVPYKISLIDSKEINAFAVPGGPIYFYKGLMDLTSSDDEVASVLGHESSHIVKRHAAKQISDAQAKGLIAEIALTATGAGRLAATGANLLLTIDQLKYSRSDEAQADEYGFRYMTEAGYDPDAMASFFRKMQAKAGKGGGGPIWLQDHPLTSKRIEAAQKRADDYKASRGIGSSATPAAPIPPAASSRTVLP